MNSQRLMCSQKVGVKCAVFKISVIQIEFLVFSKQDDIFQPFDAENILHNLSFNPNF